MGECCERPGYQATFGDRFARRVATRYRKRGLNRTQRRLLGFLTAHGVEGASVLEIGGGVGDLQIELLGLGAATVTNLEISTAYEAQATDLLDGSGLAARVTRRIHDIATDPDDVDAADIVVLHRVVCCYQDYERLLAAAGSHARRLLVFSHPPRNALTRTVIGWDNLMRRLRHNDFRGFVHPPEAMVAVVRAQGLTPRYRHHGPVWDVVGFERAA